MTNERDPSHAVPAFREAVERAADAFATTTGINLLCYCWARDPWTQARLYRQSRSTAAIRQAVEKMRNQGAPWLADVLWDVGPQRTAPAVTGALPGLSWHQWGEAVDAVPVEAGVALWDRRDLFAAWGQAARAEGLTWGGDWKRPDRPHAQLRAESSPLRAGLSMAQIDAMMRERWS